MFTDEDGNQRPFSFALGGSSNGSTLKDIVIHM